MSRYLIFLAPLALASPPAIAAGADHSACLRIVQDAYSAARAVTGENVEPFLLNANRAGTITADERKTIAADQAAALQAIGDYIDTLSDACERMR